MTTIEIKAIQFETACEAIQWTECGEDGVAVRLDGKNYVMDRAEAHRLEMAGVEFAFLHAHVIRSGEYRIVTVPVN